MTPSNAAGKVKTCHHHLQMSNVAIHMYPALQLMQANGILKMKISHVDCKNHENTSLKNLYVYGISCQMTQPHFIVKQLVVVTIRILHLFM